VAGPGDREDSSPDDTPAAVDALVRALEDPDAAVRDRAARALGDRRDPGAIPALAAAVVGGKGGRGAVWALTQFDGRSLVAPLAAALRDPDPTARALAAGKLAELGDPAIVPALVAALDDQDDHVREEVARALGRLGDPAALDPLLGALRKDRGAHVREEAATAVGALGAADGRVARALMTALADRHVAVRRAAAEALVALEASARAGGAD
jgi:HEAT repeat protein